MKKNIPLLILLFVTAIAKAQQPQPLFAINPYPKTISVSGSAFMEIVPDKINVNIELSEYQKKGDPKKDIESIKNQFLESCKSTGIPDSAISIVSYSGNNNYYFIRKKKKNTDLFAAITYQVKFKNSKMMDDLVEKLDDNATQNFTIASVSHSRISEFRKQLKIKAIQAAREKGVYLTEAIGEKLGEAITINEPSEWQPFNIDNNAQSNNGYFNFTTTGNKEEEINTTTPEVDFKKMKLRFEVNIVFALK
jgi:uncharacterized protein YggE